MVDYSSQVMSAAKESSPEEDYKFQDLLRKRAEATAKQFGQAVGGAPAPKVSLEDAMTAQRQATIGEYDRRKAAATGAYGYAQKTGQTSGDISERIRGALFGRQQSAQEIAEAQRQQALGTQQAGREATQGFGQELAKLNFAQYKTEGDRMDALNSAWKKGTLEMEMLEAARGGALELADIDRMFQLKYNDLENTFKDWESMTTAEFKAEMQRLESDASNTNSIISGIFQFGGAILSKTGSKK
jgi:hypothetical protein